MCGFSSIHNQQCKLIMIVDERTHVRSILRGERPPFERTKAKKQRGQTYLLPSGGGGGGTPPPPHFARKGPGAKCRMQGCSVLTVRLLSVERVPGYQIRRGHPERAGDTQIGCVDIYRGLPPSHIKPCQGRRGVRKITARGLGPSGTRA